MNSMVDETALRRLHGIGGDRLLVGMLDLFLTNLPVRVGRIRTGLANRDVAEVRQAAHSLKSTAGNLGAATLSSVSAQIERHADEGDLAAVQDLAEHLAECADATSAVLHAYRAQHCATESCTN